MSLGGVANRESEFPWVNDRPCADCGEEFRPKDDEDLCLDCREWHEMQRPEVEG